MRFSLLTFILTASLPIAIVGNTSPVFAQDEFDDRCNRGAAWEAMPPELRREDGDARAIIPDPRHEIQTSGGVADFWYFSLKFSNFKFNFFLSFLVFSKKIFVKIFGQ